MYSLFDLSIVYNMRTKLLQRERERERELKKKFSTSIKFDENSLISQKKFLKIPVPQGINTLC